MEFWVHKTLSESIRFNLLRWWAKLSCPLKILNFTTASLHSNVCRLARLTSTSIYFLTQKKGKKRKNSFSIRKTAVTVEIFWLSFCVFACAFPTVISSIFGKSFHFPFPYFVLFVFRYLPFHVVYPLFVSISWFNIAKTHLIHPLAIFQHTFLQKS